MSSTAAGYLALQGDGRGAAELMLNGVASLFLRSVPDEIAPSIDPMVDQAIASALDATRMPDCEAQDGG